MQQTEFHWERLSTPQITAAAQVGAIVVVPVGSIEQHGQHLPTMTDSACVEHLIHEAVVRLGPQVPAIIAPSVRYGYSHDHLGFPGTLSLSARLLEDVLVEIGSSVLSSGFNRIVFVNGHGSNSSLLYYVVRRIREMATRPLSVAAATYWTVAREQISKVRISELGGMGHACELETSLMLHFEPGTVDMSRAVREVPAQYSPYRSVDLLSPGVAVAPDRFAKRTKSGVQGDPLVASADHGAVLAEVIVPALTTFLLDFASWELVPS